MTREDWTLLTIAAACESVLSPVQLQKSLFLVSAELSNEQRKTDGFYRFEPYDYGPFASEVYSDAEFLERLDLVTIRGAGRYRTYRVTPEGSRRAVELRRGLRSDVCEYLDCIVTWVRSLTFQGLVSAIYTKYPQMRANSIFRG